MRPAIALGDIVRKAQDILVIAVIPLHRGLNGDAIFLSNRINRLGDLRCAGAVEMFDKGLHPALIFEHNFPRLSLAQITEQNPHAGVQKGQFTQAMLQRLAVIFDHRKRAVGGQKAHRRSRIRARPILALRALALLHQRRFGKPAIDEAAIMLLAIAMDGQVEPVRQSIDHRHAHAMKPARNLVRIGIELAARMQLRHDDFCRRPPLALMHAHRDAAPIIGNLRRAIRMQRHRHEIGMSRQRFINGIIDNLIDHMMQARAVIGIANIHARPLAHRLQPFENLDGISIVRCAFPTRFRRVFRLDWRI